VTEMTRRRSRQFLWIGGACLVFACSKSPGSAEQLATISAKVAQAAAAVTGQDAPLANDFEQGRYLGFDTNKYPGDETMRAWKSAPSAPYAWVGYYLPSPCHKDTSWMGKRQALRDMGWGIAVVYVGQQSWGRAPRTLSRAALTALERKGTTCSADFVSATRGAADAEDAIARVEAEGFGRGTIVFLDVERMEQVPTAMREYYQAWVARVLGDGRYQPGIYAHKHNADLIYRDVKPLFVAAGYEDEPRFWISSAKDFDPSKSPADVGHAFAGVWQGVIDVMRSVADVPLPIDINISAWASPSESGIVTD
jgi:Domain of unknown function (DUF1906)